MSDLLVCIANGVQENLITEEQGKAAADLFTSLVDEVGEAAAARQTFDQLKADALHPVSYTHLTLPTTPYV